MSPTLFAVKGPFGVRVEVQSSLLFLVGLFMLASSHDMAAAMTLLVILVGSIVLHEFGHAWGHIIQGREVERVVIHGGGGFCQGCGSATPRELEFIVAMGPIVNLVLWAAFGLLPTFLGIPDGSSLGGIMNLASHVNFFLTIFNLIPVHPLDGGKLFQLLLLRFFQPKSAARLSGATGFVFSVLWIPAAIFFFFTFGWVLFFFPSIADHWRMARS